MEARQPTETHACKRILRCRWVDHGRHWPASTTPIMIKYSGSSHGRVLNRTIMYSFAIARAASPMELSGDIYSYLRWALADSRPLALILAS